MKKRVLVVVGGRSGEHEISLISGKHILKALDRKRFEPILLVIQKDGVMTLGDEAALAALPDNPKKVKTPSGPVVSLRPFFRGKENPCLQIDQKLIEFDIAFPILHGPGGEDGTIQGLFELAEIPVVGCDVKASAMCMDKAITKKICQLANVPVVPFIEIYRGQKADNIPWPFPVFVKPATLGSSLGVSKVKNAQQLSSAVKEALEMDEKILIEPAIEGRELEIAVLGKRSELIASPAGEIKCQGVEFYSYDAKYVDEDSALLIIPAEMQADALKRMQAYAISIFEAMECRGMARIDFFMKANGEILLNEVNTIPGFTPISMYPKLMGLAGVAYTELLSRLIDLAN